MRIENAVVAIFLAKDPAQQFTPDLSACPGLSLPPRV